VDRCRKNDTFLYSQKIAKKHATAAEPRAAEEVAFCEFCDMYAGMYSDVPCDDDRSHIIASIFVKQCMTLGAVLNSYDVLRMDFLTLVLIVNASACVLIK